MLKYEIESSEEFETFTKNIENLFKNSDILVHNARNQIKILKNKDIEVAVKAYRIPSFFNRIMYTFFRKSKAYRAYHYAKKLENIGIDTPKAYSYICFYKYFLLEKSYFVSEKINYEFTMKEVFNNDDIQSHNDILIKFGEFARSLHDKNVEHKDLSPGNILVKKNEATYSFAIVDINRMNFAPMNFNQRMQNLCKLWTSEENLKLIAHGYCLNSQLNEEDIYNQISSNNKNDKKIKQIKKKIKSWLSHYK